MKYYKVIVRELDGLDRVVEATQDQLITESAVVWDSRTQGEVPGDLLAKAKADDEKRERDAREAHQQKKQALRQAIARLKGSNDPDIKAIFTILKHLQTEIDAE